jgi:hypothetical protein
LLQRRTYGEEEENEEAPRKFKEKDDDESRTDYRRSRKHMKEE